MSVNDYFLDSTFSLEIPKTLDEVLKTMTIKEWNKFIKSDILLSIEELASNHSFIDSYYGVKAALELYNLEKISDMKLDDFLGVKHSINDYVKSFDLDFTALANDINSELRLHPVPNLNMEQLTPLIENAVEKALVKHEENSLSKLDKFKRKNITTKLIFILITYFIWLYGDDLKLANKKFIDTHIIHPLTNKEK